MAARRKTARKRQSDNGGAGARAFTVVVEEINSKINVFGEKLQALDDGMRAGFQRVDERFEAVDRRFDRAEHELALVKTDVALVKADLVIVKADLGFVKADLGLVKSDLELVKSDLGLVKTAVLETNREVKALRRTDEHLDATKVDRREIEGIVEEVLERKGVH